MAEPQPPNVQEGAADPHAPTATASDLQAAALLSSLDAHDDGKASAKEVDGVALDKAMKKLNVEDPKAEAKKKNVKVEPAQVNLLIRELDVSKQQATELLKSHDGNTVKAMTAFVTGRA